MPNYAYVSGISPPLTRETSEAYLKAAVLDVLGPRWVVEVRTGEIGVYFLVYLPGTAEDNQKVWGPLIGEAEDMGWVAKLQDEGREIAFPHGPSTTFERWAQGCIEEELSERLGAPLNYDADDSTYPPGERREYRRGKTVREYILRNFDGEVKDVLHQEMLDRMMFGTPEGFRG